MEQKEFRLSPLTAEFIRPETELAFQQEKWRERSRQNKFVAWIWIAAVLGVWMWTGLSQPDLWGGWSLVANLFAGFCVLLASQRAHFYVHYDLVFSLILLLLLTAMALVVMQGKPGSSLWISFFITIPLLTNIALNIRSLYAWIATAFGVVVFYRMLRAQGLDEDFVGLLMVQLLISSGVGVVIHRLIGSSRRMEFSKLSTEKNLNDRLALAKGEAEKASRAKSDFLSNMSHEFRTPMNGVLGLSGLLAKSALTEGQRDWVQGIQSSASSLMGLLDDLLDLAKIEAGQLRLKRQAFSVKSVVEESLRILRPMALEKGLELCHQVSLDDARAFFGDASRVKQILINLLMNAVKFTDRGGIRLRVEEKPGTGGRIKVCFTIQDTGRGIPPDEKEKIFDKFFQSANEKDRDGGTGLGLAIVRELVDQMGGEIEMESREGEGTIFRLAWEWEPAPEARTAGPEQPVLLEEWKNGRVLLAEDNRINALVAVESLKALGVGQITVAVDGHDFLRLAGERAYDLILLDLAMPRLGGLEAMERLRRQPGPNQQTPAAAMTAYVDEFHRERCRQAGMASFLSKPFSENELVALLKSTAPASTKNASLTAPGWDRKEALRRMGGNQYALKEALRMAEEDFPHYLEALKQAVAQGSAEDIRRLSHAWKGAASVLNAGVLAELAGQLGVISEQGDRQEIEVVLEKLEQGTRAWLKEAGSGSQD